MSDETKQAEGSDEKLIKVTFRRPHRHGGVDYKPGDKTGVTKRAREKLIAWDVIKAE